MPDQDIVDYIRENKFQYSISALKKGLLEQGVSYDEIKEALDFLERDEEQKISEVLNEDPSIEDIEDIEEDILIASSIGKREYIEKANQALGVVTDVLGIAKRDKKTYIDAFKYGALAFLFLNLITILARYLGGRLIIGGLVNDFGTSWNLHFPDIFWAKIAIFPKGLFDDNPSLVASSIWALIVGGVATSLFIRFLTGVWPFNTWAKLSQKMFYFYLIFNLVFGFIFVVSFAEFSFRHLIGYALVVVGIVGGSYLASNYFANIMETKHGEKIKEITLKID